MKTLLLIYSVLIGAGCLALYFYSGSYATGNHGPFFGSGIDRAYQSYGTLILIALVSPVALAVFLKLYERHWIGFAAYAIYFLALVPTLKILLDQTFD